MAHDYAIFAARQGKTSALHRLDLAVPHAGQIGAQDIGCRLQHPLFPGEGFDVEARSPWLAGIRQDGDGRIHSAGFHAEFAHRSPDLARRTIGQLNVHARLSLGVDADMQVKQMRVDRRQYNSGLWMPQERAVVRGRPDWNPAPLAAQAIEVILEALALLFSTMLALENAIGLYEGRAACFETVHLLARSENIGSELGNIPDRPGQQRRYDRLGNARCPVLADVTIAGDASWCTSGPRLK